VAWGAYASSIETTYFARVARALNAAGHPVNISILAAGAWTSDNELKALRSRGLDLSPDVVLIFDGLNDLTLGNASEDERVTAYLSRMREARDLVGGRGARLVMALQPMMLNKRRSAIEERVLNAEPGRRGPDSREERLCAHENRPGGPRASRRRVLRRLLRRLRRRARHDLHRPLALPRSGPRVAR
jgi:hypothetical protein